MRTFIVYFIITFFCCPVVQSRPDSLQSDSRLSAKKQSLSWLDSTSQSLTNSTLLIYVDSIESALNSLSEEQTSAYLFKALDFSQREDTQYPKIYYLLAEEYYSKLQYDSSIFFVDKLLILQDQAEPRHLALALEVKASSLLRIKKYAEIQRVVTEYGSFLKENFPNNYLFVFNTLLHSYMIQSMYDAVIKESQEGIQFARKHKNYRVVVSLQNRIAAAHKNNKNFETAQWYLFQNLQIVKENPDPVSETYVNFDLGMLYRDLGKLDSAIFYMKKSISLMNPFNKNSYSSQLATLYVDNSQFEEARQVLDSIDISLLMDQTAKGEYLYAKGMTYFGFGDYTSAIASLDSALVLRSGNPREIVRLKKELSKLKLKTGESTDALALFKEADIIEDSLFSLEKQKEIAKLEALNQLSEKEKEIYQLEATATRNQILLISACGLVILLVIIASLSVWSYRMKRKANEELSIKNTHLKALRQREKQLAETTIHAKEQELTTMAMAAHEKNTLLKNLEQKVSFLEKKQDHQLSPEFKDLKKTISNSFSLDRSWENFHNHFQDVHPQFFENLKQLNPNLTHDDLKLSAYLKIGMSNKEIAGVIHLTVGSVKTKVNRLKKKLEMGPDDNLRNFMSHNN
ncbi:tetratricopeptide repeat protein [Reichenbachiella sp.]|uniref:tetratricopeptide repeat protein n=1 Tax=Reichenbachiella sp. TaxID=2184521 RepID=UPI003BB0FE18